MNARYMGHNYIGQTKFEFLSDDRLTKNNRYALQSIYTQELRPGLFIGWDINSASDKSYFNDFSHSIIQHPRKFLNQEFNIKYNQPSWKASILASHSQFFKEFSSQRNPNLNWLYDRLPQATITTSSSTHGFNLVIDAQYTHFKNNHSPENSSSFFPSLGDRIYINPQLSYHVNGSSYFITPKIQVNASHYDTVLKKPRQLNHSHSYSRIIPTFSLDSGLIFKHVIKYFDSPITQTIEPRLFYVRTPYFDQRQYPLFDSGTIEFNLPHIFTENLYSGHDRISEENQLAAVITSRLIKKSREEFLRFSIGQKIYFAQHCSLIKDTTGNAIGYSDLLLSESGYITQALSINNTAQYSQRKNQWMHAHSTIRWRPGLKKFINLSYQLDRDEFIPVVKNSKYTKRFSLSAQWPLSHRWYGVTHIGYSWPKKAVRDILIGLEYKADCWTFRVVGKSTMVKSLTHTKDLNKSISMQFELNGLSSIISN